MSTLAADITNTILPSDCHLCGAPLVALSRIGVCEACVARLGLDAASSLENLCTRCGDPIALESARFAAAMGVTECMPCRLAPPGFERAVSFAVYDGEMREMLHKLKYDGHRAMAQYILGERLAQAILPLQAATAADVLVVPVPLFAARERERGFNQSRLLAECALKSLRRTAPAWKLTLRSDILVRVKDTRSLFSLDPGQRRRALVGAFQIATDYADTVRGREVILIDDIMTTGATARACTSVLLRAGAAKVWVATVARSRPEVLRGTADERLQRDSHEVALWSAPARTRVVEPDIGKRFTF